MGRLSGRAVVVTRLSGPEDGLCARLRELGALVRELPAIEIAPPQDPGPLDAALRDLSRFDWVVFASAVAVERVLFRLGELCIPRRSLEDRFLAVVGPATGARLSAVLRPADLVAVQASGEGLARTLALRVKGKRVLLPRPQEGRPELLSGLVAAGAEVLAVEAYRTLPVPAARLEPLRGWLARREVDAVAFASPSAVKAVLGALGGRRGGLEHTLLAAIGPTTAKALAEAGLSAGAVAVRPTGADLADAIAKALAGR